MTYQWAVRFTGSNAPGWGRRFAYSLLFLLLTACGSFSPSTQLLSELPPLQYQGESLELEQVKLRAPTPDLLALDEEMLDFVHRYTAGINSRRQRLHTLHRAVGGSATLGLEYDPFAGGTALEAFHSQSANCLSYANLFIALAREVGLDARYQWVDVRPSWTRMGERVAVRLHVANTEGVLHMVENTHSAHKNGEGTQAVERWDIPHVRRAQLSIERRQAA